MSKNKTERKIFITEGKISRQIDINEFQKNDQNFQNFRLLPLKPGGLFFVGLAECKYPIEELEINIPNIIVHSSNQLMWLSTNENGYIMKAKQNDMYSYFDKLQSDLVNDFKNFQRIGILSNLGISEKASISENNLRNIPFLFIQNINNSVPTSIDSDIKTYQEAKFTFFTGPTSSQIYRQFIPSYGNEMTFSRIFYNIKSKATFSYKFVNKSPYNHPSANLNKKFNYYDSKEYCSSIYLQKGKMLDSMIYYVKNLINFLNKAFGYRIESISCDFLTDQNKKVWLLNVKSFILERDNYQMILAKGESYYHTNKLAELREESSNSEMCRFCGGKYNKTEINRKVTYKSLVDTELHIQQRGYSFNIHNKISGGEKICSTVLVCSLCFEVISYEMHLKEIEKKFAKMCAINLPEDARSYRTRFKIKSSNLLSKLKYTILPEYIARKIHKWRVFVYLDSINLPFDSDSQAIKRIDSELCGYNTSYNLTEYLNEVPANTQTMRSFKSQKTLVESNISGNFFSHDTDQRVNPSSDAKIHLTDENKNFNDSPSTNNILTSKNYDVTERSQSYDSNLNELNTLEKGKLIKEKKNALDDHEGLNNLENFEKLENLENLGNFEKEGLQKLKEDKILFLNKIRVYYFFSLSQDIDKFLNEELFQIKINTKNDEFIGSERILKRFTNCEIISEAKLITLMFRMYSSTTTFHPDLKVKVGIVYDGEVNSSVIKLSKEKDIYVAENSYYSSNYLPNAWIEIFNKLPNTPIFEMNENKPSNNLNLFGTHTKTNSLHSFHSLQNLQNLQNLENINLESIGYLLKDSENGENEKKKILGSHGSHVSHGSPGSKDECYDSDNELVDTNQGHYKPIITLSESKLHYSRLTKK